jgi:hypothetical protein
MLFHFSPRAVINAYEDKYGQKSATILVTATNMREMVGRIMALNGKYSVETVQKTLHYLVNRQPVGEYADFQRLHAMIDDNVPEWYEDVKDGCLDCW